MAGPSATPSDRQVRPPVAPEPAYCTAMMSIAEFELVRHYLQLIASMEGESAGEIHEET